MKRIKKAGWILLIVLTALFWAMIAGDIIYWFFY